MRPCCRSIAPINWAIINGERETGLTTFLLNHEIDKGAIIDRLRMPIGEEDTVGTMYEKLMAAGVGLVLDTVDRIAAGSIAPTEQQFVDESTLRPAPKIFKEDCRIDWSWNGRRIIDFIRGLSPYPSAWSELRRDGHEPLNVKVFSARFEPKPTDALPGTIRSDRRDTISVACADGWIDLLDLQLAGKKRITTHDLLLGFREIEEYAFPSVRE